VRECAVNRTELLTTALSKLRDAVPLAEQSRKGNAAHACRNAGKLADTIMRQTSSKASNVGGNLLWVSVASGGLGDATPGPLR
jgi:hypothetical protein